MKNLFIFFFLFQILFVSGQFGDYFIDFDSQFSQNSHIIIDTISDTNNIWQIGTPNKPEFESAYSLTKAIVTDTLNPYPINDTSSFIIKHIRPGVIGGNWSLQLNFWFKMNSDSLSDYGKIEASIDNGNSWINLITEDSLYNFLWLDQKPVLTGNTNNWQHFAIELNMLTYLVGYSDTLLYKFTFISDSIQTNKSGWMIDDFQLSDWWEGIDEINKNNLINIYPNPSKGEFSIKNESNEIETLKFEIYNNSGKTILNNELNTKELKLNLSKGLYHLKLFDNKNVYCKKIIID